MSAERREDIEDTKAISNLRGAFLSFSEQLSPRLMLAAVSATALGRATLGPLSIADGAAVLGTVAFWFLFEWGAHVLLLHAKPRLLFGRRFDPLYARVHRAHHREPWRLDRVLVPSRFIVAAFLMTGAIAFGLSPDLAVGLTAWATFCVMALGYEWIHFLVHTGHKPQSRFYRAVWRNHRLHHFKSENYWFGLTTTMADRVFGTAPSASDVQTSTTTHTLGVEEET